MKKLLFLSALVLLAFQGFSQELPSTTRKPVFERSVPAGSSLPSVLLREAPKEDFKLKDDPTKPKPLEMMTKKELLSAGDFIERKWAEDEKAKAAYAEGQNLGSFTTKGTFVELYARDNQYVDGDRIRVYVNGKVVTNDLSLGANFTPILVVLKNGFNTIEIEALNQGSSGPNTAAFKVFDEQGKPVTESEWNLLTGARASMIVVKN
ncbi:hypothetical protein FHG64_01490 [Antarcticibacterium flavum]|uniref:Secreted protein n=1 Tax=Antarcticibacterium flavum TaxID=2058175 RepID=A0A5B7WYC8_9FLAO|nr:MULTISPECIES: hypothetical protein [Antarcticibacterium]MCM4158920.1 hypothetical protein [Antarcticibacterium sp. W02-3]QCY68176.1 hypothetical protein FHG64_01490 [Antarcticibacterium flavum]